MAIAVIGAVVMSLGIFPIYALAKNLLKEEKYRRWSVLFYALSATMTYTMTYVSEVLFVPVMVWLIYLLYGLLTGRWQGKKKIYRSILAIAVWFVAYLTKEIALVIPAALVLYFVTEGMRGAVQRKRQSGENASIEQNVEKKKTGKWLAEQLGRDPSTISKWCTNVSQPDLVTLSRIAELLNIERRELINKSK